MLEFIPAGLDFSLKLDFVNVSLNHPTGSKDVSDSAPIHDGEEIAMSKIHSTQSQSLWSCSSARSNGLTPSIKAPGLPVFSPSSILQAL